MGGRERGAAGTILEDRPSRSMQTRLDFARAVLEGPVAWRHSSDPAPELQPTFVMLGLVGTVGTATSTLAVMLHSSWPANIAWRFVLATALVVIVALVAASTWSYWRRNRLVRTSDTAAAIVRAAAMVSLSAFWLAAAPPALAVMAWPIGVLIGLEAAVVGRLIGTPLEQRQVLRHYFLSPFHLGLAASALSMVLLAPTRFRDPAITALVSIEIVGLSAALVHHVLNVALLRADSEREATEFGRLQAEARHRAHWIHDDVCAEIRQLRLRMNQGAVSGEQLTTELDTFEARIRERQLDEVIAGGSVTAAEVLQPFVRQAQSAGVVITAVPNFDDASVALHPHDAQLLKRCVAGFVINAINAGTTTLGFLLATDDGYLRVEVTDDAGGFDLATAPAGRGLWTLKADLGPQNLRSIATTNGTTMVAVLTLKDTP